MCRALMLVSLSFHALKSEPLMPFKHTVIPGRMDVSMGEEVRSVRARWVLLLAGNGCVQKAYYPLECEKGMCHS